MLAIARERIFALHAHLVDEGVVSSPLTASPGTDFLHHLVYLLEREAFRLGNEKVGEDGAHGTGATPDLSLTGTLAKSSTEHEYEHAYEEDSASQIAFRRIDHVRYYHPGVVEETRLAIV